MKQALLVALLLVLAEMVSAESTKTVFSPFTGKLDFITKVDSTTLPSGSTQYIQNNPDTVQVATITISGQAQIDHDRYTVYSSSPTGFSDGNILLAQDPSNTLPCIFFFVNGARYHMCGCPETGGSTNTGQCTGLLCGVTYP